MFRLLTQDCSVPKTCSEMSRVLAKSALYSVCAEQGDECCVISTVFMYSPDMYELIIIKKP